MDIDIQSNDPIFFDTETCGLHGVAVLIQWAQGDGPIHLHSVWTRPIHETLELIEKFASNRGGVVLFNAVFDWFHICKLHTIFRLWHDHDELPENIVDELAGLEPEARDGPCVKPVTALDLMLHARKGPYQSTMDRGDVRIRRVPTAIAWQLASELEVRVPLKDIYFARKKDKRAPRWVVYDIEDEDGVMNPDFKDIVLKFAPSSALKALAVDAGIARIEDVLTFGDVEVDPTWFPEELGYAPFAAALGGSRHDWRGAWPEKIRHHVSHWTYHETARRYAEDDVRYTRGLYEHFGRPAMGDDDSVLACLVAAVRWRGFRVDLPKLRALRNSALLKIGTMPTAPAPVRAYVTAALGETERLVLRGSTKKVVLEEIAKWTQPCPACSADSEVEFLVVDTDPDRVLEEGAPELSVETRVVRHREQVECDRCGSRGLVPHDAATRAGEVLDARAAIKEVEVYDKLITAGRFHVSNKIIGALSGRMSGADGLNAQGIKKTKEVRGCFPLAWGDQVLCGGDFAGFEVTIAEAVYNDARLRDMLLTCERCDGKMEFVLGPVRVGDYLASAAHANYCEDRGRAEAKRAKKDPTYSPVTAEGIWEERLESDFICPACGSKDGKKIHALFGLHCFPEHTYDTLKATSGTADDKYTRAKSGVFAMMYGGTEHTLADRLGVPVEVGVKALAAFHREFPGVRRFQDDIFNAFCSMRQPAGLGTRVEWHEPADYRETMFGFRRYFTLENAICRTLFELANKPPRSWRDVKVRVQRRDREQTAGGAAQSALYGAAFQIQAGNMRAAANHDIQSSGATITKRVQRRIWELQPPGVHEWVVQPFNIHDEVMAPCRPDAAPAVRAVVNEVVEQFRPKVPLIKMDWVTGLTTWAEKG